MKKLIAAACAVLCLCFAGTTALAQGEPRNNYTIEEANLSFTFSQDDWYVLTRDNLENNDFVIDYDQDADELLDNMESSDIYFDAFDRDITCELTVANIYIGYPRSMKTLYSMDLDEIVDQMLDLDELKSAGVQMSDYRIEQVGGQEYLRLDFSRNSDGGVLYGRQYTTIVAGRMTNFTLTSYTGSSIDSAMEEILTDLLVSVKYDGAADWVILAAIAAVFAILIVVIVLLIRHSRKKRAAAAMYGSVPPMVYGQQMPPYAPQPGVPAAPPMAYGQQVPPYAPQPGVPAAPPAAYGQQVSPYAPQPISQVPQVSAEQQNEAEEHSGHCCACGAPLRPGSHFCEQCGMRNG